MRNPFVCRLQQFALSLGQSIRGHKAIFHAVETAAYVVLGLSFLVDLHDPTFSGIMEIVIGMLHLLAHFEGGKSEPRR